MKPLKVIIEPDADMLVEWGKNNEETIHNISVEGVEQILKNRGIEELVLVEFYERSLDVIPFAEILLHHSEMLSSLQIAEKWYVENEMYEDAARVKNYRDQIEYKQHE
jgi:hypothetical protein